MNAQVEQYVTVPEGFEPAGKPERLKTRAIIEVERQGYARLRREVAPGKMLCHLDSVVRFKGLPEGTEAFESGAPDSRPATVTTGLEVVGDRVRRRGDGGQVALTAREVWGAIVEGSEAAEDIATFLRNEVAADAMRAGAVELVREYASGLSAREQLTWLRQLANGNTVKGYITTDLPGGLEVFLEVLLADTKLERLPAVVQKITSED